MRPVHTVSPGKIVQWPDTLECPSSATMSHSHAVHCPGSASLNLTCLCTRPYKGCHLTWPSQPISFSDLLYNRSVSINRVTYKYLFIYLHTEIFPYMDVCPLNTVFLRIAELLLFHCKFTVTLHCSVVSKLHNYSMTLHNKY
jgi:hypothetical protein